MTLTEALEALEKEISSAIERVHAADACGVLEIKKDVSYANDHFDFTDEQKKDSTAIYYGFLVGRPGFSGEDSLEFSASASILKREAVNGDELAKQIKTFNEQVDEFCAELSAAEDVTVMLDEKIKKQNEETDEAIAQLEKDLNKQYKKIRNISLIVCGIVIAVYILIAFLTK